MLRQSAKTFFYGRSLWVSLANHIITLVWQCWYGVIIHPSVCIYHHHLFASFYSVIHQRCTSRDQSILQPYVELTHGITYTMDIIS